MPSVTKLHTILPLLTMLLRQLVFEGRFGKNSFCPSHSSGLPLAVQSRPGLFGVLSHTQDRQAQLPQLNCWLQGSKRILGAQGASCVHKTHALTTWISNYASAPGHLLIWVQYAPCHMVETTKEHACTEGGVLLKKGLLTPEYPQHQSLNGF